MIRGVIQKIIKNIKTKSKSVILPCFDEIVKKYYSTYNTGIKLRKTKEISQLLIVHTVIHSESRPKLVVNGAEHIIATVEDYNAVFRLLNEVDPTLEPHLKTFLDNIIGYLEDVPYATVDEINEYLRSNGKIFTEGYVRNNLRALCESGVLIKEKDPDDARRNVYRLRNIDLQDYRDTKEFYKDINLDKFLYGLLDEAIRNTYLRSKEKYLSTTLFDLIQGYMEHIEIDDKNLKESVGVLSVPFQHIFFRKRLKNSYRGKETQNLEEKQIMCKYAFFSPQEEGEYNNPLKSGEVKRNNLISLWSLWISSKFR